MDEVINRIYEVERECAAAFEAKNADCEKLVKNFLAATDTRRSEQEKLIVRENTEKFDIEVKRAEDEINRDLSEAGKMLNGLKNNAGLCDEVRERIVTLIFNKS